MTNAGNGLAEAEAGPTAAAASAGPAATAAARRTTAASEIESMLHKATVGVARGRLIELVAEALRLPAMVSSRLWRCEVEPVELFEAETDDGQIIFAPSDAVISSSFLFHPLLRSTQMTLQQWSIWSLDTLF